MKKQLFIIGAIFLSLSSDAQPTQLSSHQLLAKDLFKELVEMNTTRPMGNTVKAVDAIAKRLIAAGFSPDDIQIVGATAEDRNIVLRYRGKQMAHPILFLAHLDVVEAKREDWTYDPFVFTEKDGYYYGRGTIDVKDGAAIFVADFIRLKQEGYVPDRDLILALTTGEEGGSDYNGVLWLLQNHRSLIDADYCVNFDGAGARLENRRRTAMFV